MLLALEPSLKEKIEKQYEEWMACCPNKEREIDAWIKSADEDEAVCMKYLYAYMHPCDIVSYDVEVIASYVKATLDMYANVPYAKKVPAVPKAGGSASNKGMSPNRSSRISMTVIPR